MAKKGPPNPCIPTEHPWGPHHTPSPYPQNSFSIVALVLHYITVTLASQHHFQNNDYTFWWNAKFYDSMQTMDMPLFSCSFSFSIFLSICGDLFMNKRSQPGCSSQHNTTEHTSYNNNNLPYGLLWFSYFNGMKWIKTGTLRELFLRELQSSSVKPIIEGHSPHNHYCHTVKNHTHCRPHL